MLKKNDENLIIEAKAFFNIYKKEIGKSLRENKKIVYINFMDLSSNSPLLAEAIMGNPEGVLKILETALGETGLIKNPRVRFNDLPLNQKVLIRNIRSEHLNQIIFFEGVVEKISQVRPIVNSFNQNLSRIN